MKDVLQSLFHGPIPRNDIDPIDEAFRLAFNGGDTITYDIYMKVMDRLRKQAEEVEEEYKVKAKPGCEFISSSEFRESLKKNAAIKKDPREKVLAPLTATQEVRNILNNYRFFLFTVIPRFSMVGSNQKN